MYLVAQPILYSAVDPFPGFRVGNLFLFGKSVGQIFFESDAVYVGEELLQAFTYFYRLRLLFFSHLYSSFVVWNPMSPIRCVAIFQDIAKYAFLQYDTLFFGNMYLERASGHIW